MQIHYLAACSSFIALLASGTQVIAIEARSLVGISYYRNPADRGKPIEESRWIGLPQGTQLTYGGLIDRNIDLPQRFGYQGLKIGNQKFIVFELISNFPDGYTYNRVLGAVETTGTALFHPCTLHGNEDPEIIAILTPEELASVSMQNPNRMDGIEAVVASPQNVFRFNRKTLSLDTVEGSAATCKGWPEF